MTDYFDDETADSAVETIPWVRKRDGAVVAFDAGKLTASLFAARAQIDPDDAAFHAQELSQAVLHFLSREFEGRLPTTDDISETVVKVLREIGQGPLAAAYFNYRQRREQLRDGMVILSENGASPEVAEASIPEETWDKARIIVRLQTESDLDPATAREIAASVERRLLHWEAGRIPASLVRELTDWELCERGLDCALHRRRYFGVTAAALDQRIEKGQEPDSIVRAAGLDVLRQYALEEVFSSDIAGLHQEGLLNLFGCEAPTHWAAMSVDAPAIAARTANAGDFFRELEATLDQVCGRVAGAVALDAIDVALALAPTPDSDDCIADRLAEIAQRVTRGRSAFLMVNLFGRIAPAVAKAITGGPLFHSTPSPEQRLRAQGLALSIGERLCGDPEVAKLCRINFHLDPSATTEALHATLLPWTRWTLAQSNVRFSFDRATIWLCEGVSFGSAAPVGVCQFVGLRLQSLFRRLGGVRDEETFFYQLGLLCKSAVRAGVQKREFLRRLSPDWLSERAMGSAQVVLVPMGLDAMVEQMIGQPVSADDVALAFGNQVLAQIALRAARESRHFRLKCLVDGMPRLSREFETDRAPADALGITPSGEAGPRRQLFAAGILHSSLGRGVADVSIRPDFSPETLADLLTFAAHDTQVCAVDFHRPSAGRQATLADDWA